MSNAIIVETRGAVEIVTLNRPQSLNALSPAMVAELSTYFGRLSGRTDVRVVLLQAAGRAFCAGLDMLAWPRAARGEEAQAALATQLAIGGILRMMRSCPQPIIALGQGAACGGGFSLLLASDVRLGAPDLRMNAAYIKIGLGGCDMGSSYFLPRLVGASLAAELILTGRFLAADRALRLGLLSDVVEQDRLFDTGLALADEMLATSPLGLRLSKQALNLNIDAPGLEAAFALEDRQQVMLTAMADYAEALSAFADKRPPQFSAATSRDRDSA
jgi:enoyl-CoA hydratase/carnithine racemase